MSFKIFLFLSSFDPLSAAHLSHLQPVQNHKFILVTEMLLNPGPHCSFLIKPFSFSQPNPSTLFTLDHEQSLIQQQDPHKVSA